jgi:hypothetical protein
VGEHNTHARLFQVCPSLSRAQVEKPAHIGKLEKLSDSTACVILQRSVLPVEKDRRKFLYTG